MTKKAINVDELDRVIEWLKGAAGELPSLPDISDADMAILYLRHLRRHLAEEVAP